MRKTFSLPRMAVVLVLALTFMAAAIIPAFLWGVAQTVIPLNSNDSLITDDEHALASRLIEQIAGSSFDSAAHGGSNSVNERLYEQVRDLLLAYRARTSLADSVSDDEFTRIFLSLNEAGLNLVTLNALLDSLSATQPRQ